jgi:hypothetical protein
MWRTEGKDMSFKSLEIVVKCIELSKAIKEKGTHACAATAAEHSQFQSVQVVCGP